MREIVKSSVEKMFSGKMFSTDLHSGGTVWMSFGSFDSLSEDSLTHEARTKILSADLLPYLSMGDTVYAIRPAIDEEGAMLVPHAWQIKTLHNDGEADRKQQLLAGEHMIGGWICLQTKRGEQRVINIDEWENDESIGNVDGQKGELNWTGVSQLKQPNAGVFKIVNTKFTTKEDHFNQNYVPRSQTEKLYRRKLEDSGDYVWLIELQVINIGYIDYDKLQKYTSNKWTMNQNLVNNFARHWKAV